MIERLAPTYFTYDLWGAGSLSTFGIETRSHAIEQNFAIIRRHAIGYCPGGLLSFRPKPGDVAVMFMSDDGPFWTHLHYMEFAHCFPEVGEGARE
jgi:hypothetical protein